MKKTFLYLVLLFSFIYSQAQTTGGGGEYVFPKSNTACLSNTDRATIKAELKKNIDFLEKKGLLKYNKSTVHFIWPIQQAAGFNYNDIWAISAYVDHNINFPDALTDYNCGTITYDTPDGYNHQGTDIYLWPFTWNQFQEGRANIVAAASGVIISKSDGHIDTRCTLNSDPWNAVYIQHSDGSTTWYGHMKIGSLTTKAVGDTVVAGEYLGKVGSSGNSLAPHLHFEVYDNSNNLIDPFAGSCNNFNSDSWWVSQIPYSNPNINAVMTHFTPPRMNACPIPDEINDTNYFNLGDSIYMAAYFRDQIIGETANYYLYTPAGSLHSSWSKTFTNTFSTSYWYWWTIITNPSLTGQWRLDVEYKGQLVSHNFQVGTTTNIESIASNNLEISPNPFNNKLQIMGLESMVDYSFKIFDITGREICKGAVNSSINTTEIVSGIYFMKILNSKGVTLASKKLIKF